jgi:hypothetical protein
VVAIIDREFDFSYYDIHTAVLNFFLNEWQSCYFNIRGLYRTRALIKQMNDFFLFDSLMQDFSGMPDPNGTAVAIVINSVQSYYFLCNKKYQTDSQKIYR